MINLYTVLMHILTTLLICVSFAMSQQDIGVFEISLLESPTTTYNTGTNDWTVKSTYVSSKNEGIYSEIYSNVDCKGDDEYTNTDIMESKTTVSGPTTGGFKVISEVIIKDLDSLKSSTMWNESSERGVGTLDYCLRVGLEAPPVKVVSTATRHSLHVNFLSEIPSQVLATLEAVDESNQVKLEVETAATLEGIDKSAFDSDPDGQKQIIKDSFEETLNSRRRLEKRSRHLQGLKEVTINSVTFSSSGEAVVAFTISMTYFCDGECTLDEVTEIADSALGDVTSTLTEAISSGAFTETLVSTAQAAGSSAFDNVSVDASSLQVTVTYSFTSDSPTASPVQEVDPPVQIQFYIAIAGIIIGIISVGFIMGVIFWWFFIFRIFTPGQEIAVSGIEASVAAAAVAAT